MTAPGHSPLPWHIDVRENRISIHDRDGGLVAARTLIDAVDAVNFDLIAAAVNSHAALLAAAKDLLRFNEELCAEVGVSKHYPSAEKARAAIAAAEEVA